MEIIIIILVLLFIVGGWIIRVQNKLVSLAELCENALSQIGIQQTSRWDILSNLADLIYQYSGYESSTIIETIKQRSFSPKFNSTAELEQNELLLKEAYKQINLSVEAYPTLKVDRLYLTTMESMRKYEENIRYARMMYNDSVTKFNREIKMIPNCFIASLLGFKKKDYLEVEVSKIEMPDMRRG